MNVVLMVISITLIAGNSFAGILSFKKFVADPKNYTAKVQAEIAYKAGARKDWVDHYDFKASEGKKLAILDSNDGGVTGELLVTTTTKGGKVTETLYKLDDLATVRRDNLNYKGTRVKIGLAETTEDLETGIRVTRLFDSKSSFDILTKESDLVSREINGVQYSVSKMERESYSLGGVSEGSSTGSFTVRNKEKNISVEYDVHPKPFKLEIPKSDFDGEVLRASATRTIKTDTTFVYGKEVVNRQEFYRMNVITVNKKNEVISEEYEITVADGIANKPKRIIRGILKQDAVKKMGLLVETNVVPARAASSGPVRGMQVEPAVK